ncbi:4-hydroxy-3-methylbut-2-enyl diphosphate reductase [Desulfomonile tiedjei]|uniref:4-hydroxy-3-methylbut-2-enyl diphosphate reductase n=1 Tax=Desulfomonile tiedjei (strain ATCC 49306 / DSM 6799 / DCB-1) TaxID=706587 RepID=I4CE44_DESTA|nr:4-hydroxy-3-methylbut-2-enyl diphosphate reductase [Desulfomonile tiedjei]AFM27835.1 (E)-4-hydroxy-3-methyl-but-2-enyl pyrophosphate reductase [Desulfomonile tiedjei DSM 6799]
MKIRLAKTAGFCMGVRRAVDMVLDLQRAAPPLPIVTYGPLIHNPQTLNLLQSRGIQEVKSLDEITGGTVVIRAHGISPQEKQILASKGVGIIDATCPRVARVQAFIRKHAARGHFCVIVGDEDHPEVRGLMGFASAGGLVVPSADCNGLIDSIPTDRGICLVAQTTQEIEVFESVGELLRNRCSELHEYNTICDSTKRRQIEISRLARQVEMVVVVGGKGSGNTQRLVKVAQAQGVPALHVETDEELPSDALTGVRTVGVTAGASTPNWQIRQVTDRLKEIGMSRGYSPWKRIRRYADIFVMVYGWAALAGGGLTATALVLEGRPVTWLPLVVTMLFVYSMHLLNRIQERAGAVRFNTPEIAQFYIRHRKLLTFSGFCSSAAALALSFSMSIYAGCVLLGMLIAGSLYMVPIPGLNRFPRTKWRSLKDLPGSKTPLVALGWATAASLLPVMGDISDLWNPGVAIAFVFAAGTVFWRTALSDLLDIQGDRIVGRETIPILIGVKNTRTLLLALLVFLGLFVTCASTLGWIPSIGPLLVINTLVFGIAFLVYKRRHLVDRLAFEGILDGNFLLSGLLSVLYSGS